MIRTIRNVFGNYVSLFEGIFISLRESTFLEITLFILIALVLFVGLIMIVYSGIVLTLKKLGFRLVIDKNENYEVSNVKIIKNLRQRVLNYQINKDLQYDLSVGFQSLISSIDQNNKELREKSYDLESKLLDKNIKTKNLLQRILSQIETNTSTIVTSNNQYEDLLKIFNNNIKELDMYKKGYEYSVSKQIIERIILLFNNIEMSSLEKDIKNKFLVDLEDILNNSYIWRLQVQEGDIFNPEVAKAVSVKIIEDLEKNNKISKIYTTGFKIVEGQSNKLIKYSEVEVFKFEKGSENE